MTEFVRPGPLGTTEHDTAGEFSKIRLNRPSHSFIGKGQSPGPLGGAAYDDEVKRMLQRHPAPSGDNRNAQELAKAAVASGRLSIGDANAIGRVNIDTNLTVVVDASLLTIKLTGPFDNQGGAKAQVRGCDWLTHGNVWVQRQPNGSLQIQDERYDFEMHTVEKHEGSVLRTAARNLETIIGGSVARRGNKYQQFTGFIVKFSGSPKIE